MQITVLYTLTRQTHVREGRSMAVTSWTTKVLDQAEEATEVKGGRAIRDQRIFLCELSSAYFLHLFL